MATATTKKPPVKKTALGAAKAAAAKTAAKAAAKAPAGKAPAAKKTAAAPKAGPATASKLAVGAKAPAFRLASDDGKTVALEDFAGKWLVIYFYPKDSTPGCTREACAFEASLGALKKLGAAVVGVSRDSLASHAKFRAAQGLSFPLLADTDAKVHVAYGAFGEKTMYGKKVTGAIRSTVIVDPAGKVARVWPSVKVDGHAEAVVSALSTLQG